MLHDSNLLRLLAGAAGIHQTKSIVYSADDNRQQRLKGTTSKACDKMISLSHWMKVCFCDGVNSLNLMLNYNMTCTVRLLYSIHPLS